MIREVWWLGFCGFLWGLSEMWFGFISKYLKTTGSRSLNPSFLEDQQNQVCIKLGKLTLPHN